jgi:hypothetical protein
MWVILTENPLLQAPPLFPGPRLARQDPGDNLSRLSNADVQEVRRNFRRVSSLLRVRDPDGAATTRGPSSGTGPYDD